MQTPGYGHFPAGTGLGCGFLPFDSFLLSLLPIMITPWLLMDCYSPETSRPDNFMLAEMKAGKNDLKEILQTARQLQIVPVTFKCRFSACYLRNHFHSAPTSRFGKNIILERKNRSRIGKK